MASLFLLICPYNSSSYIHVTISLNPFALSAAWATLLYGLMA